MTPPLRYRIRPASLIVMRPAATGDRDLRELRRCAPSSTSPTFTSAASTPTLIEPLLAAVAEAKPDLVVVSGDLTQRARKREFEDARAFLDRLPRAADRRSRQPRRAALPGLGALPQPARQVPPPSSRPTSSRRSSTTRSPSSASTRRAR